MLEMTQPEENKRVIEVGKNKLFLKRTDPYGFIYINYERGELPEVLKGAFTSFDEARRKIENYLDSVNRLEQADGSA